MNIPRLDYLLLGCVKFKISNIDIQSAAELFLVNDISVVFARDGSFFSRQSRRDIIMKILSDGGIAFSCSDVIGLPGIVKKYKKRIGIMASMVLTAFLFVLLNGKVWDVRIECDDGNLNSAIERELADAGVYVGAEWKKIDGSKVEARLLELSDNVAWVNINRRGNVAYVEVIKKEIHSIPEETHGYANIVASCDCIIEEITVNCGVPVVKVGQSVKRGDLLISGIIPTELGGGFCYADGEVKGRYSARLEAVADATAHEKIYTESYTDKVYFNFFDFSINIFKNYSNSPEKYDIIEEKKNFSVNSSKRLPFSFSKTVVKGYETVLKKLSSDEMISLATKKMQQMLSEYLCDKELLSISSGGGFSDQGYTLYSDIVCRGSVAKTREFEFISEKK